MKKSDRYPNKNYANDLLLTLEEKHILDQEGLSFLLRYGDFSALQASANRVREKFVGEEVHLRGLIEFSNYCRCTCFYCGLRGPNAAIQRYRLTPKEIFQLANHAVEWGIKTIVLQSGEDIHYPLKELYAVIEAIKKWDVAVTLSLGELPKEIYRDLKNAGADRYLLRIETTNSYLYQQFHPHMNLENRKQCLWHLKDLGYEVGTGCLTGFPGQTANMLAEDLLFFKNLAADMIGLGPFIPCEHTPLEKSQGGDLTMTLKMLSLTRLLLPDANIPATTALATKSSDGYTAGLQCGANVIMPNMGMAEYKQLYAIYPGKVQQDTRPENELEKVKRIIKNAGRVVGKGKGSHQSFQSFSGQIEK
jgi:biotin synthase